MVRKGKEEEEEEEEEEEVDSTSKAVFYNGRWKREKHKQPLQEIPLESNFQPLLNGAEPPHFVKLRVNCYRKIVSQLTGTVERLRERLHAISLGKITEFIRRNAEKRVAKSIFSSLGSSIPTMVVSAGVSFGDHQAFFERIQQENEKNIHVPFVKLKSYECQTIKNAVCQFFSQLFQIFPFSSYNSASKVSDFDVVLDWYEAFCRKHKEKENTGAIVILFEDFDFFEPEVIERFIHLTQRRRAEFSLPFLLIFGVGSFDKVLKVLDISSFSLLLLERTDVPSAKMFLDRMIDEFLVKGTDDSLSEPSQSAQLSQFCSLRLSSNAFMDILDGFLHFHVSFHSFVLSLRLAILEHFFYNPLSFYCLGDAKRRKGLPPLTEKHLEYIRSLPSFRQLVVSKKEPNGSRWPDEEIKQLKESDQFLRENIPRWVGKMQSILRGYGTAFRCFEVLRGYLPLLMKNYSEDAAVETLYCFIYDFSENKMLRESFGNWIWKLKNDQIATLLLKWVQIMSKREEEKKNPEKTEVIPLPGFKEDYKTALRFSRQVQRIFEKEQKRRDPKSMNINEYPQSGSRRSMGLVAASRQESSSSSSSSSLSKDGLGESDEIEEKEEAEQEDDRTVITEARIFIISFIMNRLCCLTKFPMFEALIYEGSANFQNPLFTPEIVEKISRPEIFLSCSCESNYFHFEKMIFTLLKDRKPGSVNLAGWMNDFKALEEREEDKVKNTELYSSFFGDKQGVRLLEHRFLLGVRTMNFLGFSRVSKRRPDFVELLGNNSIWRASGMTVPEESKNPQKKRKN